MGVFEILSLGFHITASHPSMVVLKLLSLNSSFIIFSMLPFAKLGPDTESLLRNVAGRINLKVVALMGDQIPFEHSFLEVVPGSEEAAVALQRRITLRKVDSAFLTASPFKSSVSYLYNLLDEPDVTLDRVEKCVLKEPLLVSRIFQTVNSADNLRRNRIELLGHALAYLGIEGIKQVVALLIFANITEKFLEEKSSTTTHSKCCAFMAEKFAAARTRDSALLGKIKVASLLHDLGALALEFCFPDDWETFTRSARMGQDSRQVEKNVFGIEHGELGVFLCKSWSLPKYVQDTIELHHSNGNFNNDIVVETVSLVNLFLRKEIDKWHMPDYPIEIMKKFTSNPELKDDEIRADVIETLQSLWFKFGLQNN